MTPADYRDGRAWDLAAAIPLMALCLLASSGFAIMIVHEWPSLHDGATLLVVASQMCSTVFLLFQAGLLLVRRLPIAKAQGSAPRRWAVIGANFAFLMLLVPKAAPTPLMASVSSVLVLMGTACSIYTLGWLGKSFAVFPQARQLVRQGPYRFVRSPTLHCRTGVCFRIGAAVSTALELADRFGRLAAPASSNALRREGPGSDLYVVQGLQASYRTADTVPLLIAGVVKRPVTEGCENVMFCGGRFARDGGDI